MADRYVRMNILSSGGDDAKKTLDDLAARARLLEAESPDLKITADDTKASATLKDLQLKIELLNRMRAEVSFETKGDEEAKAALLDMDAKLRELSEKVAKPDIKIEGMDRAEADLIRIKLKLDDLHNKHIKIDIENAGTLEKIFASGERFLQKVPLISKLFGGKLFGNLFSGSGGGGGGVGAEGEAEGGTGSGLLSALGGANNEYFGGAIAGLIALAGSVAPAVVPFGLGGLTGIGGAVGAGYMASSANTQLAALKTALAGVTGTTAADKKQRAQIQAEIAAFEKSHAPELNLYSSGKSVINQGENSLFSALTQPEYVMGRSGNRMGAMAVPGSSFLSGISDILKQISNWIKTIGPSLGDMFRTSLPFLDTFVKILEQFAAAVLPAVTTSMKEFQPYLPQMMQAFKLLSQGIADFIVDLGPGMKDGMIVFKAVMEAVKGILIGLSYSFDGLAIGFVKIGEAAEWEAQRLHEKWDEIRHDTAETFDYVRHLIASDWDNVYNDTIGFGLRYIDFLSHVFQDLLHDISSIFDQIRHETAADWDAMWHYLYTQVVVGTEADFGVIKRWFDDITSGFDGLRHSIASVWDAIWSDMHNAAVSGVSHLTSAVHGIISAFETPVKFVVDNVWDKLAGIWNSIQNVVHIGFKLPVVHMATGGRIPGYGGGDTVPALLERGEVVVDKDRASALAPVFRAAGVPGFSGGGIVGDIGGFFSGLGKDIMGWITKPLSFITQHVFGSVESLLGGLGNTGLGSVLKALVTDVIKSLTGTLHTQGASIAPYSGAYGPGVAQWRPDVLRVLGMLGLPAADAGTVLAQMMTESGGNPNAINLTDSNAAAGDPSRGLMQTIMSTFEAYRSHQFPNDIYNPLANIYAGLNYAIHRYGNPGWLEVLGHGHGYANGGWITEPIAGVGLSSGMRYALGEQGPEYVTPAGRYGHTGGDTYNFAFNGFVGNERQVSLEIVQSLRRFKRQNGNQDLGLG